MALNLFGRLMPREVSFTRLFREQTACIVRAVSELKRLMDGEGDPDGHVAAIRNVEMAADDAARQVFLQANRTFGAPIDREDIVALAHQLDDVVDMIEDSAKGIRRYGIDFFSPQMRAIVDAVARSADAMHEMMPLLDTITKSHLKLLELCERVGSIEGEADDSFDSGLAKLRARLKAGEIDTLVYIDRKEIYELLEEVVDKCNDVANTVQAITAKHV